MKLSIIIPCYNAEKTIKKCFDSLINQEDHLLDIEVLIFNDGSTDNSLGIIEEVTSNHKDICKIFNLENQGVYRVRNLALKKATGDFIWFIDADDFVAPNSLSLIKKNIDHKIDIVNFGYKIENRSHYLKEMYPPKINGIITGIEFLDKNDGRLYLWNNVYNLNFLKSQNISFLAKSKSLEDSLFNLEAYSKAKRVKYLHNLLYYYIFNPNSISKTNSLENRLKQGESSINVHFNMKILRDSFELNTIEYNVINHLLNKSILGFFFSLFKERYPIEYCKNIFQLYKKEAMLPIKKHRQFNLKAKLFRLLANNKFLFLTLCKLNFLRKK
uniref:glycosyltransferase n=1 Tax=Ornithobacterium rhinotracheale TaxID=28251 RepID=UPI0039A58254